MLLHTKKCPDCGSVNVKLWVGGRMGMIYECHECGYRGPLIVEEDVEN
jgi:predicted RNA-binding Zn-ribbon protein involved in translation (DUF1610 family)